MDQLTERAREDEINLLDYIIVIFKWKELILGVTIGAVLISALIGFLKVPLYKAETRILVPQQSGSSLALSLLSQMGSADVAGATLGIKTSADLYADMLKGRTIADRIIDRFGLMELYKARFREDARKTLIEDALAVRVNSKSGIITVSVEDPDPKRAAQMANAIVEELKNLTKGVAITEAAQRRLFFEEQLRDVKLALLKSEEELKKFGEKTGAIKVDEQAKALIESIANLRAQIAAKEVELRVMKTYSTSSNPDLQRAEEALKGLRTELAKLETKGGRNPDPLLPAGRIPEIGTEYVRKLRDLKFNETLYELLTKQYELAKLEEARDATVIQVIDEAIPPERKAKPNRRLMVMLGALTGFLMSLFLAFALEYKERISTDLSNKERIEAFKKYLRFR